MKTYGELIGDLHLITIDRSESGRNCSLGLSLVGNKNISVMSVFVVAIKADTPVARDARIRVGDELLEVGASLIHYLYLHLYLACTY